MVCLVPKFLGGCGGGDEVSADTNTSSTSGAGQGGDESNVITLVGNEGEFGIDASTKIEVIDPGAFELGTVATNRFADLSSQAIGAAGHLVLKANEGVVEVGKGAIASGENVATAAIDSNERVVVETVAANTEVVGDSLSAVETLGGYSFDLGADAIESISEAFEDVSGLAERIARDGLDAGTSNAAIVAGALEENTSLLTGLAGGVVSTLEDINASQQSSNRDVLTAVTKLGETTATDGANLENDTNRLLIAAAVLALGVVAWTAVKQ